MRRHNCRNFVFSSSATVYGDPASVPITEDFPVGATTNPYGTTKAFTERILTDVCKADPTLNVALLRYFNPIEMCIRDRTYKAFEITPENVSQIQKAMEYTYIIPNQPAQ